MSERTEVSFDAALMMALRADAQKELDELPTPAQLKERYPDTSRWDARLQAALHKRRPVLKRVLVAALTLVILTLGALAVSADFRKAVYTMIQKFLPIEMQLTYQVDGEPLEQLPNAPNERTGIARSSATVKFLYGLAGSGSRQKVTIAYDIKWSERPIYVGIDSFGIGWIAADSSSHQLATKTASAVGEVSYCYASTGNSAGLSSSVDMDTSQSGGVVGTPVIINHQNTSTYGKHISGTVGVGTQSNSSNMETIQIFVAYAHSTVSVTFSADVALQWKQVGMSINFTPQKKTTIIARGNATFKYNGQGYQTAGTV